MASVTTEGSRLKTRKSFREKLEKHQEARLVVIPPKMAKRFGKGKMLIPRPLDVDALIRHAKRGQLITQAEIRRRLAAEFQADVTCPITTGIFVRLAAEAAEEGLRAGHTLLACDKGRRQSAGEAAWRACGAEGQTRARGPQDGARPRGQASEGQGL